MRVRFVRRDSERRASAAVEMAIALTCVLAPATYGMIEMSRAVQVKECLTAAARSAGTIAITAGKNNDAVKANVASCLTGYGIDPSLTTTTIKVNGVTADCGNAAQGDQISIKISVPATKVNWMLPMFLSNSTVESGTLIVMRQG